MKYATILAAIAAIATVCATRTSASPAATQDWVRNYVQTNANVTAMSSNIVIRMSGTSSAAMTELQRGGSNAVERAASASIQAAAPAVNYLYNTCVGF